MRTNDVSAFISDLSRCSKPGHTTCPDATVVAASSDEVHEIVSRAEQDAPGAGGGSSRASRAWAAVAALSRRGKKACCRPAEAAAFDSSRSLRRGDKCEGDGKAVAAARMKARKIFINRRLFDLRSRRGCQFEAACIANLTGLFCFAWNASRSLAIVTRLCGRGVEGTGPSAPSPCDCVSRREGNLPVRALFVRRPSADVLARRRAFDELVGALKFPLVQVVIHMARLCDAKLPACFGLCRPNDAEGHDKAGSGGEHEGDKHFHFWISLFGFKPSTPSVRFIG